ncbi:hypothetical protein P4O66_021532 [Electrophorus voltai]|uniref:UBA domain-containing protein n=1 Tax=Electrophorus voltai TaxID=2609070 RepID=A0AAD8ZP92_9TELE|nr:hypothetical protein P4O66_021532 [Electrophorus voltai]
MTRGGLATPARTTALDATLGPVFALFVPFFCSVPQVQVTQLLGCMSITNKSLVYLVGVQLLTSSTYMWVVALSGLGKVTQSHSLSFCSPVASAGALSQASGTLYYSEVLGVHRLLQVPQWAARCGARLLGPALEGTEPRAESPLGMGATLDIQRQQRMDMLDQQLLLSQMEQFRRSAAQTPQPWGSSVPGNCTADHQALTRLSGVSGQGRRSAAQRHGTWAGPSLGCAAPRYLGGAVARLRSATAGGLLSWSRFLPGLRNRGQNLPHVQPHPQQSLQPHPLDTPVAEEQVARLMEMGFSRVDAQEALRASNNDINMATNFLLQH